MLFTLKFILRESGQRSGILLRKIVVSPSTRSISGPTPDLGDPDPCQNSPWHAIFNLVLGKDAVLQPSEACRCGSSLLPIEPGRLEDAVLAQNQVENRVPRAVLARVWFSEIRCMTANRPGVGGNYYFSQQDPRTLTRFAQYKLERK